MSEVHSAPCVPGPLPGWPSPARAEQQINISGVVRGLQSTPLPPTPDKLFITSVSASVPLSPLL